MTYWPTSVEKSLLPLKYVCRLNPDILPETTDPDFEFEYIDIGNVTLEGGIIGRQRMAFSKAPSRARKPVQIGDVIVSTVRTYLKAVATIGSRDDGCVVSTGFAVLRPDSHIHPRFLYRVVQSNPFVEEVVAASSGVSYPAINPSALGRIKIPLPELEMQKTVADFLDRKTAHLDLLIEKRTAFLALIEEKKAALAAKAVDGSILGVAASGVKGWFGALPDNWKIQRGKFLFRERQDRSQAGDEELLTVSHLTGVTTRAEKEDVNMFLAESMEDYKLVFKGDVVINTMWAWMGAMGVSPIDGLISPSYGIYFPTTEAFRSEYLNLVLRSRPFIAEVNRRSKGIWSSRLRLYPDAFLDILMPVPPLSDQQRILEVLAKSTEREDRLAKLSQQSVGRLREFRAALITAAVTGQIDMASWEKRGEIDRRLHALEAASPVARDRREVRA